MFHADSMFTMSKMLTAKLALYHCIWLQSIQPIWTIIGHDGLNQLVVDRFNYQPSHFSAAKFASKIDVEGLIIHDKHDDVIKYDEAELINSNFKNSTLMTTEGFGHGLRDNSVYEAVIKFIKS